MDGEPLIAQFAGEIEKVVDRFRDQGLTAGEALGALAIVQAKITRDALTDEDEDAP